MATNINMGNPDQMSEDDLDRVISGIREEVDELKNEIKEKQRMIIQIEQDVALKEAYLEYSIRVREVRKGSADITSPAVEVNSATDSDLMPYRKMKRGPALRKVFADAGGPLEVEEIAQRLEDGGFPFRTKEVVRSVRSALARDQQIVRVKKNTFQLRD